MENKLAFIIGPSGVGKSQNMFGQVMEQALKHPDRNYIIVVPEQFTMETQKKIVQMHPRGAVANIDIVSFNRLCFRVFEELGVHCPEVLDDTGKSLILRKVIVAESHKLKIYKEKVHMHGFVEEMKSVISELYMYGVDLDKYGQIKELVKGNALITEKLCDIEIIFRAFQDYIKEKYITKEALLDKFCGVVQDSTMIKKSEIYFDGFTGFTPVQNKLVGLFLKYAKKNVFTVTAGNEVMDEISHGITTGAIAVSEQELFQMSKETINVILRMYTELYGKTTLADVQADSIFMYDGGKGRFSQNSQLRHLEQRIFRGETEKCDSEDVVSFLRFANPRKEIEAMTDYIAYQVRTNGYRYRDFAIITGDMEGYSKALADNLSLKNIPFFMDNKRSLLLNPAVTFLRAILEMLDYDFSYESTFKFLKCGITVLPEDDVDILENYVLACGIRGYRGYANPFLRKQRKMTDEEYVKVNEIRERFVTDIDEFYQCMKNESKETMTVRRMTECLYQLMVKFELQKKLTEFEQHFQENGELSLSKEYGQTYDYILELMDKLVSLLGDEVLSLKDYREILEAGFEEIKVGVIPMGSDQLTVGDIERTRLNNIRILLVLGANDGIIPQNKKKSSLLSQNDRNYMKKMDIQLAPTMRENYFIQKFYLYLNLTKPSEQVILSYSESGMDGAVLRPSYLLSEIERIFDGVRECAWSRQWQALKLSSRTFALKYLAENLNRNRLSDMSDFVKELYSYFYKNKEYKQLLQTIREGVFFDNEATRLSKVVAEKLAGMHTINSVSKLEKYAECAYAHFLNYSLNLVERDKYEVSAGDMGTIYHRCIELVSDEMQRGGYNFRTISEDERRGLVDRCVEMVTEDYGNTILRSSKRNEYLIRKIRAVCQKTVWALCEHVKRGKFEPEKFEFSFKEGRIDRVDTYEEDGKLYVKIIDYKTGKKEFELSDAFYGLQMQLIYYMGETLKIKRALEDEREVLPAGSFYFQIKSPYVECSENIDDVQLQELLLEEYRMSGMANAVQESAVAMDEALQEEKSVSKIIPLKNGDIGKSISTSGMSSDNFEKLIAKVEKIMTGFVEEIREGCIDKNPYKKGVKTPCEYCGYHAICGFDEREFGNCYRKLDKISTYEEVMRELNGEGDLTDEMDRRPEGSN